MTALGTIFCIQLGCTRRRHVSAEGRVRYAHCLAHALEHMRAFAA